MRKILLLAACLSLGACSTLKLVTGSSVTPNAVYVAANAFDAAEVSAMNYDKLPLCPSTVSVVCRTMAVTKTLDAAIRSGRSLRKQLITYVNANPGEVVPVSNYNALVAVIGTIQSYVSSTGAPK